MDFGGKRGPFGSPAITLQCKSDNVVQFYLIIYQWSFFSFEELYGGAFQSISIISEQHEVLSKNKVMREVSIPMNNIYARWNASAYSYSYHEQDAILRTVFEDDNVLSWCLLHKWLKGLQTLQLVTSSCGAIWSHVCIETDLHL